MDGWFVFFFSVGGGNIGEINIEENTHKKKVALFLRKKHKCESPPPFSQYLMFVSFAER